MHARRLDRARTDASRRRRVAFFVLPETGEDDARPAGDGERPDDAPRHDDAQTTFEL